MGHVPPATGPTRTPEPAVTAPAGSLAPPELSAPHTVSVEPRRLLCMLPGVGFAGGLTAAAFAAHRAVDTVSPLVAAVALGALATNLGLIPHWARPGLTFAARRLLRVGVVLLGLQLSLGHLSDLGVRGLGAVVSVVVITFFGTRWLGRLLKVSPALSLLVATGFSICGASAVAAMETVSDAEEEDVAFAIALVTLCGSLAIVLLPLLRAPLHLAGARYGAWVGASVHDVAQVVATSSAGGTGAVRAAVLVKLTRVAMLAPLIAGTTLARRWKEQRSPRSDGVETTSARVPVVPLFVVGFLAAVIIRTTGTIPEPWLPVAATIDKVAFALALVGLGSGVHIAKLRTLGRRPVALGALSWLLVGGAAYVPVRVGHL
jgi:uncharacterized integral membrane protein (TIGR00698 family)